MPDLAVGFGREVEHKFVQPRGLRMMSRSRT